MISIVTAYYNRRSLFVRTLESLARFGGTDFEFVAVDDGSAEHERIEDLVARFNFLRVVRIEPSEKWYSNPCIPFNLAIREAAGDAIILQNPECLHAGNVLQHVREHLVDGMYLSYGCYALSRKDTDALQHQPADEVQAFVDHLKIVGIAPIDVGGEGWYNHSQINPRAFHFCAAITKKDLLNLGGFDERYATGIAYDDDDLVHRVRKSGIEIRFIDSPGVLHQNHYVNAGNGVSSDRIKRNERVFRLLTQPSTAHRANEGGWGNPNAWEIQRINTALDELAMGNQEMRQQLADAMDWQAYGEGWERAGRDLTDLTATVQLFKSAAHAALDTIEMAKVSLAGRVFWRSKLNRDWDKAIKCLDKAKAKESEGRHEGAVNEYFKALTELSALGTIIAGSWGLWCPGQRTMAAFVEAQVRDMGNWWEKSKAARLAVAKLRPGNNR
ncbi:MAG: glycosyltransferase family 2 protein [Verrucomicrobium sp.]